MYKDFQAGPVRHIVISKSTSGDTILVQSKPGFKIRVLQYTLACAEAVSVTFKSGSTAITGPMPLNSGLVSPSSEYGLFQTLPGGNLVLNLGASVQVGGHLTYIMETEV